MFCRHCGKEIDDNSVYCNFCGIGQKGEEAASKAMRSPNRKALLFWGISSTLLLVTAVVLYLVLSYRSPLSRFQEAVERKDSVTARFIYQQEIEPDEGQRALAQDYILTRVAELKESYQTPEDYKPLRTELLALREVKLLEKEVDSAQDSLERAHKVDQAFALAEQYVSQGKIFDAMRCLERVFSGDERYEEAQKRLEELKPLYYEQTIGKLDALMAEGSYEKAQSVIDRLIQDGYVLPEGYYFNTAEKREWEERAEKRQERLAELAMDRPLTVEGVRFVELEGTGQDFMEILFRNNSDRIVRQFDFTYFFLPRGPETSSYYPADFSLYLNGADDDGMIKVTQPIYPGETFGEGIYWYVESEEGHYPDAIEVQACVRSVTFYEEGGWGEPSEDPYFGYWREEMYGKMLYTEPLV